MTEPVLPEKEPDGIVPVPPVAPAPDSRLERLKAVFGVWRGKLLDLSKRNRALNYKPVKVGSVTVVDEKPAEIYRLLVGEEATLTFVAVDLPLTADEADGEEGAEGVEATMLDLDAEAPAQPFTPYERTGLDQRHRDTVLQCRGTPERLDTSLRRLADLQRTSFEEQGVNTLYLALGFLHYTEDKDSSIVLRAPLVLVPVNLERKSARAGFTLKLGEAEPILNPSLIEYLRRIRGVTTFPALPEVTEDVASADLLPLLAKINDTIAQPNGWKVTEEIALATFAFQKLVIYKDLESQEAHYGNHPLVRRVALREGALELGLPSEIRDLTLDTDYPPELTHQVVDADSSQVRAIAAVARGHDLVIHGPPGTGKSQTITNLIAQALGDGQRVLFVAEKMAALEVVHRRLTKAGLGEFCLELHSTKARKGVVLDALRRALQAHGDAASGAPSVRSALTKSREQLNQYVRELHTARTALDRTAYQVLGELAAVSSAPKVRYPDDPREMASDKLELLEAQLEHLESVGRVVAPVVDNAWRDSALSQLSQDLSDEIEEARAQSVRHFGVLQAQLQALETEFGLPHAETVDQGAGLARVAGHLAQATGVPEGVLRDPTWTERPIGVNDLLGLGRTASATRSRLAKTYDLTAIVEVPLEDVTYVETKLSGFLGFLAILDGRYRTIRRRWHGMRNRPGLLTMLAQADDVKATKRWQEGVDQLRKAPNGPVWFGSAWRGPDSNWDDLEARAAWVEQFHRFRQTNGPFGDAAYQLGVSGGNSSPLPEKVSTALAEARASLHKLRQLIQWPDSYLGAETIPDVIARLEALGREHNRGPAWVAFTRAAQQAQDGPAKPIVDQVYAGTLPPDASLATFRRSLYSAWLDRVIPGVPALSQFSTASHEDVRKRFYQADLGVLTENKSRLVGALRETGATKYAKSEETQRAFLQKELAKQVRHRPLRVTMRDAGQAVAALAPCFLMSPLSVAQFLNADQQFDLVIFDEASQLSTEDAVGAIARGKRLVVVGDPKQLPPTNFFAVEIGASAAVLDEDGTPVYEDTESVLEEMQGAGLHSAHLEWHYRSAHQSLIQFSNEHFYDNRLVVFPAAAEEGPELGVQFEYLEAGRYEGAGVNKVEAARVASAVVDHLRLHPNESLGVGTFNMRQQLAIWDAIEKHRREDLSIEPFFDRSKDEPFFVKNLENIQGDERDVIFLSITYGRQNDGKLRYNFGPLNRQEGWRRLNVLVSRARRSMKVFSSLRSAEIDPGKTASPGPGLLRDFLAFAETGKMQHTGSSTAADADSPFEFEVGEQIAQMGYIVDRQVGVGKYRIDLGVRSREYPGKYLAGVECDGVTYHGAEWARDRDRLRQQVLEGRGWTILRVWSTDWFKDRAGTLDRIRETLAALHQGLTEGLVPSRPAHDVVESVEAAAPPSPQKSREYVRPTFRRYNQAERQLVSRENLPDATVREVVSDVVRIVKKEGPVCRDVLLGRLLYLWGHEKLGARISAAADRAIALALRDGLVVDRDGWFWVDGMPMPTPRDWAGQDLAVEQVSTEELAAGAIAVARASQSIAVDDLVKEVREAMGLKRTHEGSIRLREIVEGLLRDGRLIHGVNSVRAKPTHAE